MTTHDFNSRRAKKHVTNKENKAVAKQAAAVDFQKVKELAQEHIIDILHDLAPDGDLKGKEYLLLNPHRPEDRNLGSFSINVETCKWSDFATDHASGGDIISLVAYIKGCKQFEAAGWVEEFINNYGLKPGGAGERGRSSKDKDDEDMGKEMLPVPATAPRPPERHPTLGTPDRIHRYADAEDRTFCLVYRYEAKPGRRKIFIPLTFRRFADGSERWDWKGIEEEKPLYNLRELSLRSAAPVVFVEGEKSAEAAKTLFPDHVVVAALNGSSSARKVDLRPLKGREVLIWPDNDKSGSDYANDIARLLHAQDRAAVVRIMSIPTVRPGQDGLFVDGFSAPAGWDAADALAEGWTAEHISALLRQVPPQEVAVEYEVGGYIVNDGGVYIQRKDKEGEYFLAKVCSRVDVIAQSFSPSNNEWGLLLSIRNPDGKHTEWCMPRSLMAKHSDLLGELLKRGASLQRADTFIEYVLAANPPQRAVSVHQPGWHEDLDGRVAFVMPHETIAEPETSRMVLDSIDDKRRFSSRGSLTEWNAAIGAACAGNSRLVFAVCAALTGPALNVLHEEGGGFHLYGQTSIGKSTATQVAASVWGSTDFPRPWKTTDNALESIASLHNDTLLVLDEVNQVAGEVLGDVAYMLGNGSGKARADRSGGARTTHTFRVLYLSNGEESLKLKLEGDDQNVLGGQEVRLPSIPADAGKGHGLFEELHGHDSAQSLSRFLKEAVAATYGSLGLAWTRELLKQRRSPEFGDRIKQSIQDFATRYVPVGASSQVLRVGRRFALVAAVGEEAARAGLLPWQAGEAIAASKACFLSWIEDRGGVESQESQRYISQIRRFISRYGESKFSNWEEHRVEVSDTQTRTLDRVGWRKLNDANEYEYYVLPEPYTSVLCEGLDSKAMTKFLRERDLLVLSSDGKSVVQARPPGVGSRKFYCIKSSILEGGDD